MIKKVATIIFILFLCLFISFKLSYNTKSVFSNQITKVFAEDDEGEEDDKDEDEDERDEEEDEDENYSKNNAQETEYYYQTVTVPAPKPVIKYVYVTDPGYDRDTDGDKIVDALDPNPKINEVDLFTDDDKDSVPNAYDKYPNEDDFLYIEFTDNNNNGIIDDIEITQWYEFNC